MRRRFEKLFASVLAHPLAAKAKQRDYYIARSDWEGFVEMVRFAERKSFWFERSRFARLHPDHLALEAFGLTPEESETRRAKLNDEAIEQLLARWSELFDHVEKSPLTPAQRTAALTNDDFTITIAGAGSGKTSTLMGKTAYLIESGLAQPEEILLLAYGRDAAEELRSRLAGLVRGGERTDASTFHALGNRFLRQGNPKLVVSNLATDSDAMQKWLRGALDRLIREGAVFRKDLADFFTYHAAPTVDPEDFDEEADYLFALNASDLRTLGGERVKSNGELIIANLLFRWQVPYAYEWRYPKYEGWYKPDFTVSSAPFARDKDGRLAPDPIAEGAVGAWIEYFGIDRSGKTAPWIDEEAYLASKRWKEALHEQKETTLIELAYADLQNGKLEEKLRKALLEADIPISPMTDEEVIAHVRRQNAENLAWENFAQLIGRSITLWKTARMTEDKFLEEARSRGFDGARMDAFLRVFKPVLEAYEETLKSHEEVDFADMIAEATALVETSQIRIPWRYVLVDEFQDISAERAELLKAIIRVSGARLFVVGDDWQAIYRFSGSDLAYFSHFSEKIGPASVVRLDKTYRFPSELNAFSEAFVTRNPAQLKKAMACQRSLGKPAVVLRQTKLYEDKAVSAKSALSSLPSQSDAKAIGYWLSVIERTVASKAPDARRSVLVLGRFRWPPKVSSPGAFAKEYPHLDVTFMTVHAAKGLEADYVVVPGLNQGGFPCERQSDQILETLLPKPEDFPWAEERRLFYVAVTRARIYAVVLYDDARPSVFAQEIIGEPCFDGLVSRPDEALHQCPACRSGTLREYLSGKGHHYWKCSNTLFCGKVYFDCPACGAPLVDEQKGRYCLNRACSYVEPRCPRCARGFLRLIEGTHSNFYGCSNWNDEVEPCRYTEHTAAGLARSERWRAEAKALPHQTFEKRRGGERRQRAPGG